MVPAERESGGLGAKPPEIGLLATPFRLLENVGKTFRAYILFLY